MNSSAAYHFTMHNVVADIDDILGLAVPPLTPRAALVSVETLLDGLDAVKAVYEPTGR